jgi:HSP20 family protein
MVEDRAIKKTEGEVRPAERMRDRKTYAPNVDILEKEDELLVLADMPGVRADNIDIHYEQAMLTIHGKAEPRQSVNETQYLLREYGVGDFYRSFRIGEGIDADKIHAELSNGVLELHLPKSEEVKPRRIEVKMK